MDYLLELNDSQRAAVENIEGPTMVIAGAGSGKTRVLTYRIVHLLNNDVKPYNVLSLTFTNKAAKEMKGRIEKIVGSNDARQIWMGTFHSIFAKILRFESDKIGYPSNFTIYDAADTKNLLKDIIKGLNLDDKIYKPNVVYGRISSAKNNLINAASYANNASIQTGDRQSNKPKIGDIYKIYERRCFNSSAMDFDDLLFKTNVLLRDFPEILDKYQDKFKYILVDEFQDTNFSQYTILQKLAARFQNICVVGDDAQSIYAFRGANIQNILNFKKHYPSTQTFKLEQNYRSTQNIVKAANAIIGNNKEQIKKNVWTSNDVGEKIKLMRALTDNEEGLNVANEIVENKTREQLYDDDFAILYRTNAQSRSIEEALRKKNLPYRIFGGLSFYQRKEIKDLLSYFRIVINPNDEEAFKRVVNYPKRGIGKASVEQLIKSSGESNVSAWEMISMPGKYAIDINVGAKRKLYEFHNLIRSFQGNAKEKSAYDLGSEIAAATGLLKELHIDKSPEGVSRYENIQELLNGLKEFSDDQLETGGDPSLMHFMEDVALLTDADNDKNDTTKRISLMTIHASKGLEFPHVFIVGLEENLFPSQMALNSRSELEEERRLFYVAMTRAEQKLHLSFAASRYKWGSLTNSEPSRFIEEIDKNFLDFTERKSRFAEREAATSSPTSGNSVQQAIQQKRLVSLHSAGNQTKKFNGDDTSGLKPGTIVEHARFGEGEVKAIEGTSPNQKATVLFDSVGEKQLLLKFAKLKVLS